MLLQPLSRAPLRVRDREPLDARERLGRREPLLLRPELRLRRALRLPAELRLQRLMRELRNVLHPPAYGVGTALAGAGVMQPSRWRLPERGAASR